MSSIATMPMEHRVYLHQTLVEHQLLPSCITCRHVVLNPPGAPEGVMMCNRYNQRPPLKIVVTGCIGWEADVPF